MFNTNYNSVQAEFKELATSQQATLFSLPLTVRGPADERLSIEIAWLGSKSPKKVLLHIIGTHGVEGYPGSAIQRTLLQTNLEIPEDSAVIFVHGLNPWGMAHLRRVNENNVDLNRNFYLESSSYSGAPRSYQTISSFLNPEGPPKRYDSFYLEALLLIARYGFNPLKQAITGGQYEFPQGIYFGGEKLEESLSLLAAWTKEHLSQAEEVFVIEVHSGLGDFGAEVLFWPFPENHASTLKIEQIIGQELTVDDSETSIGYRTGGDLQNGVPNILPNSTVHWIVQEFGTLNPIRMLRRLRNENQYHHSVANPSVSHWSKRELLEAFCPQSERWEELILGRGVELFFRMLSAL